MILRQLLFFLFVSFTSLKAQSLPLDFSAISFTDSIADQQLLNYKKKNIFLYGYKKYVSSQDAQSCAFTPSCSVYAVESVRKKGLIRGMLNALDRLTRCHTLSLHLYEKDPETHLPYDPVE